MKIYYFDTSAIIKRYHREDGSKSVNKLFEEIERGEGKGVISYLCVLESLSAIVRRKKEIKGDYRKVVKAMLLEYTEKMTIIPVDNDIMTLAMKIVLKHGLRSLDAMHLATVIHVSQYLTGGITVITSDIELYKAAEKEGFTVLNPEKE